MPLLALLVAMAAACNSGSRGDDQATGDTDTFVAGDFTDLPKPAGAQPLGDPTVTGGTTIQSFQVAGSTAQQVITFYEMELGDAGWEASGPSSEIGDGDWQGTFVHDGETLTVTASSDPNASGSGAVTTQLDLSLTG